MQSYDQDGVRFQIPPNWSLEKEEIDEGWFVSVQSPGTAFLYIVFDSNLPDPDELASATLEALKKDYPELEAEEALENISGQAAVGHNLQFFSFDLAIECKTRCLYSPEGTILLLLQKSDEDEKKYGPALQALWKSIQIDME